MTSIKGYQHCALLIGTLYPSSSSQPGGNQSNDLPAVVDCQPSSIAMVRSVFTATALAFASDISCLGILFFFVLLSPSPFHSGFNMLADFVYSWLARKCNRSCCGSPRVSGLVEHVRTCTKQHFKERLPPIYSFTRVVHSIVCCRILLNIRDAGRQDVQGSVPQHEARRAALPGLHHRRPSSGLVFEIGTEAAAYSGTDGSRSGTGAPEESAIELAHWTTVKDDVRIA